MTEIWKYQREITRERKIVYKHAVETNYSVIAYR